MTALIFTEAAERDLTEISLRIAADSPRAARHFVQRIREHCAHLTGFPDMGSPRANIRSDIRALTHGSYVIYYRRNKDVDEVYILRIWHGRRKTPTIADLF